MLAFSICGGTSHVGDRAAGRAPRFAALRGAAFSLDLIRFREAFVRLTEAFSRRALREPFSGA